MTQECLKNRYNWKIYTKKSDQAYKTGLDLEKHGIQKNGHREIQFALDIGKLFLGTTPKGRALDVACGNGYLTNCLSEKGFDTTGVDISEEGIQAAKNRFKHLSFSVCDATKPNEFISGKYDLIYFREFHPFSRVDDPSFHKSIIDHYMNLLNDGGLIVIAHGKGKAMTYHGEARDYPGINFSHIRRSRKSAGPFYYFAFNHLRLRPRSRFLTRVLSWTTGIVARATRNTWIEYFVIVKSN